MDVSASRVATDGAREASASVGSTTSHAVSDCADFLTALFGTTWAPRRALLWSKRPTEKGGGGWSTWIQSPAEADAVAGKPDVYIGAGLVSYEFDGATRARAVDRTAIPGVWLDVDVNGGPEKRARYAPDEEAALDLVRSLGPAPSVLVHSGYGIQAWWLLHELWTWQPSDQESWQQAKDLVHGFWMRAQAVAAERGFRIDSTWDLARIMRLPGTINAKDCARPAPVAWIDPDDEYPRYEIDELKAIAMAPRTVHRGASVKVQVAAGGPSMNAVEHVRARLSVLLENDDRFRALWDRSDARLVNDTSASGWCMAIAHRTVAAGWMDQEIADLLVMYRAVRGDRDKPVAWYELTIARARDSDLRERAADVEREIAAEALDTLTDLAHQPIVDPTEALAAFNSLVPGLQGKELLQQGTDPSIARYRLVLADEKSIEIGGGKDLRNPDTVAAAIMVVTGHTMMPVKRDKWLEAVRGLVKARRHVDYESLSDIARDWLTSYLDSNLADDDEWNEAAYNKKPFVRNGDVHIHLDDFSRYVRRNLGEKDVNKSDVQARLVEIGFTTRKVACNPPLGRDSRTSRKMWVIKQERVEG